MSSDPTQALDALLAEHTRLLTDLGQRLAEVEAATSFEAISDLEIEVATLRGEVDNIEAIFREFQAWLSQMWPPEETDAGAE